MGVDAVLDRDTQPFYNVIGEGGSKWFAAQENLKPIKPEPLSHPEIGRFFESYQSNIGYLPNKQLAEMYPDDKQCAWSEEGNI